MTSCNCNRCKGKLHVVEMIDKTTISHEEINMLSHQYVAGLFDAEGCVYIQKHYQLSVKIVNTNLKVLKLIKNIYGGDLFFNNDNGKNGELKSWEWYIVSDNAIVFLKKINIFLIEKKKQVDLAIEYQENKSKNPLHLKVPIDEIEKREKFRKKINELKYVTFSEKISTISTEYLAGFFDGEGCISMNKNFYHQLQIQITNTNIEILKKYKEIYGGNIREMKKYGLTKKNIYQWIDSSNVILFLKNISSFVIIKRNQVLLSIDFLESITNVRGVGLKLSQDEIEKRESFYIKIKGA